MQNKWKKKASLAILAVFRWMQDWFSFLCDSREMRLDGGFSKISDFALQDWFAFLRLKRNEIGTVDFSKISDFWFLHCKIDLLSYVWREMRLDGGFLARRLGQIMMAAISDFFFPPPWPAPICWQQSPFNRRQINLL